MIEYECKRCHALLRQPSGRAGHRELCPGCGYEHTVPRPRSRAVWYWAGGIAVGLAAALVLVLVLVRLLDWYGGETGDERERLARVRRRVGPPGPDARRGREGPPASHPATVPSRPPGPASRPATQAAAIASRPATPPATQAAPPEPLADFLHRMGGALRAAMPEQRLALMAETADRLEQALRSRDEANAFRRLPSVRKWELLQALKEAVRIHSGSDEARRLADAVEMLEEVRAPWQYGPTAFALALFDVLAEGHPPGGTYPHKIDDPGGGRFVFTASAPPGSHQNLVNRAFAGHRVEWDLVVDRAERVGNETYVYFRADSFPRDARLKAPDRLVRAVQARLLARDVPAFVVPGKTVRVRGVLRATPKRDLLGGVRIAYGVGAIEGRVRAWITIYEATLVPLAAAATRPVLPTTRGANGRAERLLKLARMYRAAGKRDKALELYEQAAEKYPHTSAGREARQEADKLRAERKTP